MHVHYDERVCPDNPSSANFKRHLARYRFATPWVRGQDALDAGCGAGYGADYLAGSAVAVVGVDSSLEAIEYARGHYRKNNLKFSRMNCESLDFKDGAFGVVCAFEVIEHVESPEKMLREIVRVLAPSGTAIFSTPNKAVSSPHGAPDNPYHLQEFDHRGLVRTLSPHFKSVEIWGQRGSSKAEEAMHGNPLKRALARLDPFRLRRLIPENLYRSACGRLGFATQEDLSEGDYPIGRERVDEADYFVAVCGKE